MATDRKDLDSRERARPLYRPVCSITEHDGKITLYLEMPGVAKQDLSIHVEDNQLKVSGKRRIEEKDGTFLVRERTHGDFYTEYTLDDTINHEEIEASLKNGLVTVTLSRREAAKPRQIPIKTG